MVRLATGAQARVVIRSTAVQRKGLELINDYRRRGVTMAYAALEGANGGVIGDCQDRHRDQEYVTFLLPQTGRRQVGKVAHLIVQSASASQ